MEPTSSGILQMLELQPSMSISLWLHFLYTLFYWALTQHISDKMLSSAQGER